MRASSFQKGIGMKNFKIRAALTGLVAATLVAMAPQVSAQTVFVGDIVQQTSSVSPRPYLTMSKSIPSGTGAFAYQVVNPTNDPNSNVREFASLTIAEATGIFMASSGDLIDSSFVVNAFPQSQNRFTWGLDETRYFAYWDDRRLARVGEQGVDATDSFGWMSLTRIDTGIRVNASATVTGGSIRVGSFTAAVPEPETWALLALGLAGMSVVRRRV
jgi:hypothetical protein